MVITQREQINEKINWYQVFLISLGLFGYDLISFLPAQLNIENSRLFSVPYRGVFLLLSILVLFKYKLHKADSRNYSMVFILMFWGIYIIRLVYDTVFNFSLIVTPLSTYWLFAIGLCFIPLLAFRAKINNETLNKALYFTFFVCLAVNLLGLNNNINNVDQFSIERQAGNDFLNPISYGQAGASLAILSLILFIRNRKKGLSSLFFLFGIPIGVWTLIVSLSRGPIIDFLILLILLFFNSLKSIYIKILSLLVIIILIITTIPTIKSPFFETALNMLQSRSAKGNQSDEQRLQLMAGGWNQFIQHPFFGDLLEERTVHAYPHNLIIESLMTCGIIGGVLMIVIQLKSIYQANKLLKNQNTTWIALLFVMQLISSMVAGGIYADYTFWYLLVLVNTLYFQQQIAKRKTLRT